MQILSLIFIGIIIGITNIVPGVSSTSMALIFKVYKKLILGLHNLSFKNLKLISKTLTKKKNKLRDTKKILKKNNLDIFFTVILSALAGIFLFSKIIEILMKQFGGYTTIFFFGVTTSALIYFIFQTFKKDCKKYLIFFFCRNFTWRVHVIFKAVIN